MQEIVQQIYQRERVEVSTEVLDDEYEREKIEELLREIKKDIAVLKTIRYGFREEELLKMS